MPGWDTMVMERLDKLSGKIEGLSKEIEDIKKNLNQEDRKLDQEDKPDFIEFCDKFETDIFAMINNAPAKYCITDAEVGDVFNGILCFSLPNGEHHIHTYPFRCIYKDDKTFGILGIRDIGDFIKVKDKDFKGFTWEEATEIKFKAYFYDKFDGIAEVISKWCELPTEDDILKVGEFDHLISTGFCYWTRSAVNFSNSRYINSVGAVYNNVVSTSHGCVPFSHINF